MKTGRKNLTIAHLPQQVGTYRLVEAFTGQRQLPGQNWVIRCESCKERRIINTSLWNAAYKGTQTIRCACQKKGTLNPATKRKSIFLTFNNESLSISDWAERTGIPENSIRDRHTKRNGQHPLHQQPDEWVIFGTDKSHSQRKKHDFKPNKDIDKILDAITAEALDLLKPRFIDAVTALIEEKVRPLLYGLASKGTLSADTVNDLVTVTDIPEGNVISKDGESHYNPAPHINDSEMVTLDATYREVREYYGDELAEFSYWPLKEFNTDPTTGCLALPANIEKHQQEQAELKKEEQRRKDAELKKEADKVHVDCLPGHQFALWRESLPRFRLSDQPTPEELPKQEDTIPLSDDEVKYFLDTPWWQKRVKNPFNIYNFGPICRTQYERIKAFHVPPQKQYPKGCDMAVAFKKSYSFCDSHRNLNSYLDFFAISEWCDDGRLKPDIDGCIDALVSRFVEWAESDVPKVRMQADRLLDWFPALASYIKEHCPEWVKAYLPQETDMTFLDTDNAEPTELHPVT